VNIYPLQAPFTDAVLGKLLALKQYADAEVAVRARSDLLGRIRPTQFCYFSTGTLPGSSGFHYRSNLALSFPNNSIKSSVHAHSMDIRL
jgi:hypothetical protein